MSNNGNLSPERFSAYIPQVFPLSVSTPVISIFWSDVDTTPADGGFVWYRYTTDSALRQRALTDIQRGYPALSNIDYLFIATWDHVGYYQDQTDRVWFVIHNSKQIMINISYVHPALKQVASFSWLRLQLEVQHLLE